MGLSPGGGPSSCRLPALPTASQTASFSLALYPPGLGDRISLSLKKGMFLPELKEEETPLAPSSAALAAALPPTPPPQDSTPRPALFQAGLQTVGCQSGSGAQGLSPGHFGAGGRGQWGNPILYLTNFKMWGVATPT